MPAHPLPKSLAWIPVLIGVCLSGLALSGLAPSGLAAAESVIEIPLVPVPSGDGDPVSFRMAGGYMPRGYAYPEAQFECPPGEWILPERKSARPVYALVRLGDRDHLALFDADDRNGFYGRCRFDANANRDLTDDPVLRAGRNSRTFARAEFTGIRADVRVDGASIPYILDITLNCRSPWNTFIATEEEPPQADIRIRGHTIYQGEVKLRGTPYSLILCDRNANGRFDDGIGRIAVDDPGELLPLRPSCDRVYLGTGDPIGSIDYMASGDRLLLGGSLYDLRIDVGRRILSLSPVTEPLHRVRLAAKVERLTLATEDGRHAILLHRPGETVKLPAGRYRVHEYTMFRNDPEGDRWRLRAGATRDTPFVTVTGPTETSLSFGEPFTPLAHVRQKSLANGDKSEPLRAAIEFVVEGAAREVLTGLDRVSGNRTKIPLSLRKSNRPKEPAFKVVLGDGEIVAKGAFRYG